MQTAYPSATWQWHLAQVVEPVGYAVAGMRPTYNARAVAPAMYARRVPGLRCSGRLVSDSEWPDDTIVGPLTRTRR